MKKPMLAMLFGLVITHIAHAECELANTPDDPFVAAQNYGYKRISAEEIDIPASEIKPGKVNWYRFLGAVYNFMRANPTLRVDALGPKESEHRIYESMSKFSSQSGSPSFEWKLFGQKYGSPERYEFTAEPAAKSIRLVFHP